MANNWELTCKGPPKWVTTKERTVTFMGKTYNRAAVELYPEYIEDIYIKGVGEKELEIKYDKDKRP